VIPLALPMHRLLDETFDLRRRAMSDSLLGWLAVVVVPGLTGLALLITGVWAVYALRMGRRAP
jgi:hypothetical protein